MVAAYQSGSVMRIIASAAAQRRQSASSISENRKLKAASQRHQRKRQ